MTLPAFVRINAQFPFPSLVQGGGPITVGKAAGIWTVGFTIANLTTQVPPVGNYLTDYVIIWDSIAQTFFKVSLSTLVGTSRTQRSVLASPIVIGTFDMMINFNINSGSPTCALPLANTRSGVPLTFKDVGGHAFAHNLTISATGSDLIDGQATYVVSGNYGSVTLNPFNDGVNTGWFIT